MPHPIYGSNLSKSKIQKTIKLLRPSERQAVLEFYWELIPDDKNYTDDEKAAFVIAAMPGAGMYPADIIRSMLLTNIAMGRYVNPRDYAGTKPNLYRRLGQLCPGVLQECLSCMRPRKHVPEDILQNDMFIGLLVMMDFIDWLYDPGQDALRKAAMAATGYTENAVEQTNRVLEDDAALAQKFQEYSKALRQNHMTIGTRK